MIALPFMGCAVRFPLLVMSAPIREIEVEVVEIDGVKSTRPDTSQGNESASNPDAGKSRPFWLRWLAFVAHRLVASKGGIWALWLIFLCILFVFAMIGMAVLGIWRLIDRVRRSLGWERKDRDDAPIKIYS